jgi:arylformamidase
MKLYDISLPISDVMPVWPGDPPVSLVMISSISKGDPSNLTEIRMGAHTGTHIDAPYHYLGNGAKIESIPLETFVGPCLVVEVDSQIIIRKEDLQRHDLTGHSRIILKTSNSKLWDGPSGKFATNYVAMDIEAAEYLAAMNIVLVGTDYLSVEAYGSVGAPVHRTLLENKVTILEGLNLSGVPAGEYELICAPIRLVGCEAAPARVLLRTIN